MNFRVVAQNSVPASASPYRLVDDRGRELSWANEFLDAQRVRQLSLRSLRAYAFDLLHLGRWLREARHSLAQINQSLVLQYVRDQLDESPQPTPRTINRRLCVLRCLYHFHHGRGIPGKSHFQRRYKPRAQLGYGRPQQKTITNLQLREPRRIIVPLSAEEVARFWRGFRTFRDLAIVALMLLDGLRSCEVLQNYLHLERPLTNSSALFVSLKGRRRGSPMTAAGLRSLFRHHRLRSRVPQANPHRFRHTFGSHMVRAGMSLPALMHLMGHADIHTTMLYVELAPEDVWREYARAVQQRVCLSTPGKVS